MNKKCYFLGLITVLLVFASCNPDTSVNENTLSVSETGTTVNRAYSDGFNYCIDLNLAKDFTLFLKGNLNQSNVDSLGKIAAGGNISLMNYGVGLNLPATTTGGSLIAGGRLDYQNGIVYHGDVIYGSLGILNISILNGTHYQGSPIDFNQTFNYLESLSTVLAGLPVNSSVIDQYGALTFSGINEGLNVFSISGAAIQAAHTLDISIPAGAAALINITGSGNFTLQYKGLTSNMDNRKEDILFNLPGFTSFVLQGIGMKGSILAPFADIQFNNGNIDGSIIGKSLSGNGESHYFPFNPKCVPSTPTPIPTETPTPIPTETPTPIPTETPTPIPTEMPTPIPTEMPTPIPTEMPTPIPTEMPTPIPTEMPTPIPTEIPSPSISPSLSPSDPPPTSTPEITSIIPAKATKGSHVIIMGNSFGDNGIVKIGSLTPHILSWTDTTIEIEIIHYLSAGIYDVIIVLSDGSEYVFFQSFEFVVPELDITGKITAHAGDQLSFSGKYFGSSIAQFSISLLSQNTTFRIVTQMDSWYMDPDSNESVCTITIPEMLPIDDYFIQAKNYVGLSLAYDGLEIIE